MKLKPRVGNEENRLSLLLSLPTSLPPSLPPSVSPPTSQFLLSLLAGRVCISRGQGVAALGRFTGDHPSTGVPSQVIKASRPLGA